MLPIKPPHEFILGSVIRVQEAISQKRECWINPRPMYDFVEWLIANGLQESWAGIPTERQGSIGLGKDHPKQVLSYSGMKRSGGSSSGLVLKIDPKTGESMTDLAGNALPPELGEDIENIDIRAGRHSQISPVISPDEVASSDTGKLEIDNKNFVDMSIVEDIPMPDCYDAPLVLDKQKIVLQIKDASGETYVADALGAYYSIPKCDKEESKLTKILVRRILDQHMYPIAISSIQKHALIDQNDGWESLLKYCEDNKTKHLEECLASRKV